MALKPPPSPTMASRLFAKLSRIRSIAPVNLKTSVPRCSAYAYVVCAAPPPVGRAREIRRLIQGSSPKTCFETISGGEGGCWRGKWGGLFWATSLEKIFGGVIAIVSFPGGWMQQSAVPRCAILSVRSTGGIRAVKRTRYAAFLREVLMNEKDPCIGNSRRGPRA